MRRCCFCDVDSVCSICYSISPFLLREQFKFDSVNILAHPRWKHNRIKEVALPRQNISIHMNLLSSAVRAHGQQSTSSTKACGSVPTFEFAIFLDSCFPDSMGRAPTTTSCDGSWRPLFLSAASKSKSVWQMNKRNDIIHQ
mmetsp:Transcript_36323/g.61917  ORF Transcript_36323/g.61917 Transcript_36323/m.61917 type:complete len:141 (-) Transcript_36323:963-1385(-)